MTLIPMSVYFNGRGRAKVELALAKGKKLHDKRETTKARDWKRDQQRLMRERGSACLPCCRSAWRWSIATAASCR
jgi:SsrA-binding protein